MQEHLAATWRAEGYDVDRWDIDVEGLERDPQFPGMEVERRAAIGVTATLTGDGTGPTLMLNGHTDVVPPGDIDAWSGDPFTPRLMTVDGSERDRRARSLRHEGGRRRDVARRAGRASSPGSPCAAT